MDNFILFQISKYLFPATVKWYSYAYYPNFVNKKTEEEGE